MANFNFDHSKGDIGSCIGLKTAGKIEITIHEWVLEDTGSDNESISHLMEKITNHKTYSKHEKLFAMFYLGGVIIDILTKSKMMKQQRRDTLEQLFDTLKN